MSKSDTRVSDDEKQRKPHEKAARCIGVLAGGNPCRAEMAREAIRRRLKQRYMDASGAERW